jgi:hypothetical protein
MEGLTGQINNFIPIIGCPCLNEVGVEIDHDAGDCIEVRYYYAYPFVLSKWDVLRVKSKAAIDTEDIPF